MKNFLRRCLALLSLACWLQNVHSQSCPFRLDMHDSFGDGWNGGILVVNNGPSADTFFLASNASDSTVYFPVNAGLTLQLVWISAPFFNQQCSFALFDNDGELLFQAGNPPAGSLYVTTAACVACLKPVNVLLENVYDTYAKLRWSPAPGIVNPQGWRVVYGPKGFAPGPGAGDSLYVATPKATIPGLQKKTWYDVYVQQDCGNGGTSDLQGPFSFETYRSDDVGITAVLSPQNGCDLGLEKVKIVLTNFGSYPQSLIPFNYSINGEPSGVQQPDDGFYTGVLGKDSSAVLEFETSGNFFDPVEYVIAVWTNLPGDEFSANDTFYYRIANRLAIPFRQDFEAWNGAWHVDSSSLNHSWQYGQPSRPLNDAAASGQQAWVTNLTGLYRPNERSYLRSPCFDFSNAVNDPVIEFSLNHSIDIDYDGAWLEMSLDDGASWAKVGAVGEGLNWYNSDSLVNVQGAVWEGESGGWVTARHALDGAAGLSPVYLRFAFASDVIVQQEGIGVDDIYLYEPFSDDIAGLAARATTSDADCGLAADNIIFRIGNFGTDPQTLFNVAYSINGAAPVVENVGNTVLTPNDIFEYTFNTPFDSRNGAFEIKCWTNLTGELNTANDTAIYVLDHTPAPVPFQEDFESGLPAGWLSDGIVSAGHNNVSNVLGFHMYVLEASYNTELPNAGIIQPGDSLTFDYRITNFTTNGATATTLSGNTRFEVQVSTGCDGPFQTVYTINKDTHTPSTGLQTVGISLSAYAGKSVKIRVLGVWTAGNFYFDIDNVNLRSCPAAMNLSAQIKPAAPGQNNGTATVNVGLGNPPYQYTWSTGATSQTVNNLAAGTYTVTVVDAFGCSGYSRCKYSPCLRRNRKGRRRFNCAQTRLRGLPLWK